MKQKEKTQRQFYFIVLLGIFILLLTRISYAQTEVLLTASDKTVGDNFGTSVSIDGDRAIVGAEAEGSFGTYSGAAYVFERDITGSWIEVSKLQSSDIGEWHRFGHSVSIDGDRIIVGAMQEYIVGEGGAAYIFERDVNGNWIEVEKIQSDVVLVGARFGRSVSLDGDRAAVGAWNESGGGAAYIFEPDGFGNWMQIARLEASDINANENFGCSVSLNGEQVIVGAYNISGGGAAYVFEHDGNGNWIEADKIHASDKHSGDRFGYTVSLEGDRAIIGAHEEDIGAAYIFEHDGNGNWIEVDKIQASDKQAGDWFGYSVSLSGERTIVGARFEDTGANDAGAAYIFEHDGNGNWMEVSKIQASNKRSSDQYGNSVSLDGDRAIVGAYLSDPDFVSNAGAAYLYLLDQPMNHPPTDITLSNSAIDENSPVGTVIGILTATDPDPGENFTFSEINDPDDKFSVFGNELQVDGILDYETSTSHNVTIRVKDKDNLIFDKLFTISVNNIQESLTLVVTHLGDSGPGSLRYAIQDANANPGPDKIIFSVTGTISLLSALPYLSDNTGGTMIDGTTAPGYSGGPVIELSGFGLWITSANNVIHALQISLCISDGISIIGSTASNNVIAGCYVGTDGISAVPNNRYGIYISLEAFNNRIGTDGDGVDDFLERNIISGNLNYGIHLTSNTYDNIIAGNYIGVDATGSNGIGNGGIGINIHDSHNNRIGTDGNGIADDAERNVISGNNNSGISIYTSNNNKIAGNYIGTDATGTYAILQQYRGVTVFGGIGNRFGTDGNGIGDAAERNVISGNTVQGFDLSSGTNGIIIAGNLIGTDVTGTIAIGNGGTGVNLGTVSNTRIGTDGNGIADDNERNIISGDHVGILAQGTGTIVAGNYIGTDVTGTIALGNSIGVYLVGSVRLGTNNDGINDAAERNIISGNSTSGVKVNGSGGIVAGNYIGTDVTGNLPIGNSSEGVYIYGTSNAIISNTIAFNGGEGVLVLGNGSTQNKISQNSIFTNGTLGIDLSYSSPNGVTPNDQGDGDVGANNFQNFPLINLTGFDGVRSTIGGTLNSVPNTVYDIEVFSNMVGDPSGNGEGETFLGTTTTTTDGTGNGTWSLVVPGDVTNLILSSTATDPAGNTSEFSAPLIVNLPPNDIFLSNDNVSENSPIGTVIGSLIAADPDPGETFTFSEVNDPDGKFSVVNDELLLDGILNYEISPSHDVTIRVTDSGNLTFDKLFTVIVTNVNEPPSVDAGEDQEFCSSEQYEVTLDGSGSSDPENDPLTYTWFEDVNVIATGVSPNVTLSIGMHTIMLTVDDGNGNTDTDEVIITIHSVPSVTFNPVGSVSIYGSVVDLTPYISPAGGTFSGTGITGNDFDPAVAGLGPHTITYTTLPNANGCTNSAEQIILVVSTGTIAGTISENGTGLEGVTVKLLDLEAMPTEFDDLITDANGQYSFTDVPAVVDYLVMIVEPLGYSGDINPKLAQINSNQTTTIDFYLTQMPITNEARSIHYWKHQFDVYVKGHGNAKESEADLYNNISLIDERYTPHFQVFTTETSPGVFETFSTFEEWQNVLSVKGNSVMEEKAQAQLATLLMNMVSLKIAQWEVVTDDNRTAGDVLTYVSLLLTDADVSNDELAEDLARTVNMQKIIDAGIVPDGGILYKGNSFINWSFDVPEEYTLYNNFPNPFNPATTIRYGLPEDSDVTLKVYSLLGEEVATLVNEHQVAGTYQVEFIAGHMASGIYIYRIHTDKFTATKKLMLIK